MQEQTQNTTEINELTYEQWQELSDRLDQIQATLDKLFLVEIPKKNKKEDKKWNSPQNTFNKSSKKK